MPTNIIEAGPARTYGSGWSIAGQGINEGLQSVLGYYQEYTKQKRFEQQQKQEMELKKQAVAERLAETQARQADREDAQNMRRAQEWEKNAPMMTEAQAMELPDYTQTVSTPTQPTGEQMGAMPNTGAAAAPLAGPTTKKELLRSKKFGDYTGFADFEGKRAAAAKRAEKEADWLPLQAPFMGMAAGTRVPPAAWALANKEADAKPQFEHGPGGAIYSVGKDGRLTLSVAGKEPAMGASDKKAAKEEAEAQMVADVREGDPESIPMRYRALVVQRAEGRGVVPRGGTNNIVDALAAAYNGTQDQGNIKARAALRQEITKGSASARGGQISRLNQFAGHLNDLQDASDKLSEHLGSSDWQTINYLDQKLTRAGKKGPIAAYTQWADTVINEYITAIKGGSPTNQDKQDFATLRDTTTAPQQRQEILDAMKLAIEERANDQESVWKQTFNGKSSSDSGTPMFNENYRWDPGMGIWRHQRRGLMQGAGGKNGLPAEPTASNPFGMKKPGSK
jgi:hypothetical protein